MRLKPTFLNTDFRHHHLALSFVPFLFWTGAVILAVSIWPDLWAIPSAILLFWVGGLVVTRLPSTSYALALQFIDTPLKGSPGTHFLYFFSDPPETCQKLKIITEDAGFIYAENGCYRITTLKHDFTVPFAAFHHEPIKKDNSAKALLLRFQPSDSQTVVQLAATFGYYGNDLKIAGDSNLKCEWASKVIESMKAL